MSDSISIVFHLYVAVWLILIKTAYFWFLSRNIIYTMFFFVVFFFVVVFRTYTLWH